MVIRGIKINNQSQLRLRSAHQHLYQYLKPFHEETYLIGEKTVFDLYD